MVKNRSRAGWSSVAASGGDEEGTATGESSRSAGLQGTGSQSEGMATASDVRVDVKCP